VPRAAQELVHPRLERDLEAAHLALAALQRLARLGVVEDAPVEDVGDALQLRQGHRVERAQRRLVGGPPEDVSLQLLEQRFHSGMRVYRSPPAVRNGKREEARSMSGPPRAGVWMERSVYFE